MKPPIATNKLINGFWVPDRLTNIQKLSIQSFLDHGHQYRLWGYGTPAGLPEGAEVADAEEIVSRAERGRFGHVAQFADWFRVNLLLKFGGWYADTDVVCLRPFDFVSERVFVSEYQFGSSTPQKTRPLISNCIIKMPAGDPLLLAIRERIKRVDTLNCGYCDIGPHQFRWGAREFGYFGDILKPEIFDGLWPKDLMNFVSESQWRPSPEAFAIHLRTSYWETGSALDPDRTYPVNSWFEILKRRHQVAEFLTADERGWMQIEIEKSP